MAQKIDTAIGLSANVNSDGQPVDFDGASIASFLITNNSGISIQYTLGGSTWTTVANGSTASPQVASPALFRLRKSTADSYPVMVALSWMVLDKTPGDVYSALRQCMLNPVSLTLMSSPPTITVGTAGAASVITSGVTMSSSLIGQSFMPPTGALVPATVIDNSPEAPNSTGATVRAPINFFFDTDATKFEINYRPDSANSDFRIFVGDPNTGRMQLASSVVTGAAFDNQVRRVLVDFGGSRTYRSIEIQGMKVPFDSITVGPADSVRPSAVPSFSATVIGDSFTEGTGASSPTKGYADQLLKLLGIRRGLISGLGGTGYVTNLGTRKRLRYRFGTDIAPYPADMLIYCNGVNDDTLSYSAIYTDAKAAFDLAQAAFPNSIHIVFPGFRPRSGISVSVRDAIRDAAAGRANFYFCDTYSENEITGTGYVGATTGSGNSDVMIGSDGTHPSDAGHLYFAQSRRAAIARVLGFA